MSTAERTAQGVKSHAGSTLGTAVKTVKRLIPGAKGSGNGGVVGGVVTTATTVVNGATGGLP